MQMVVATGCKTVEEYVAQKAHQTIRAPERCPKCRKIHTLSHLGYYERGCTDSGGKVHVITIKRFVCAGSKPLHTVSCLPDFAQPYRLVNNSTTQKFFDGDTISADVQRNRDTLRRYWRRFTGMAGRLRQVAGCALGRAPPKEPAAGLWQRILAKYRTLANATRALVSDYRTTCFAKYLCHQPG